MSERETKTNDLDSRSDYYCECCERAEFYGDEMTFWQGTDVCFDCSCRLERAERTETNLDRVWAKVKKAVREEN